MNNNSENNIDPEKRFSSRVDDYIKYRPGYPEEIISFLKTEIEFNERWTVADIGSGTGILSELFLKNGNRVYCIEPNEEMRTAGESLLNKYQGFASLHGKAELIPLKSKSIDLVTAGQAFHWFDVQKSKKEFNRILRSDGWAALIWNERLTDTDKFAEEYEKLLLGYSIDYAKVDHRNVDKKILSDFYSSYKLKIFPNEQVFDFDGLKGRLLSSSYVPKESHPNYLPMVIRLNEIFNDLHSEGKVKMKYKTQLYYGKL